MAYVIVTEYDPADREKKALSYSEQHQTAQDARDEYNSVVSEARGRSNYDTDMTYRDGKVYARTTIYFDNQHSMTVQFSV